MVKCGACAQSLCARIIGAATQPAMDANIAGSAEARPDIYGDMRACEHGQEHVCCGAPGGSGTGEPFGSPPAAQSCGGATSVAPPGGAARAVENVGGEAFTPAVVVVGVQCCVRDENVGGELEAGEDHSASSRRALRGTTISPEMSNKKSTPRPTAGMAAEMARPAPAPEMGHTTPCPL